MAIGNGPRKSRRKRKHPFRAAGTNPRALGTNPRAKRDKAAEAARLRALPYPLYLKTLHWREMRAKALARWGGYCEGCGVRLATEVHHNTYERLGEERESDLTPLCEPCHRSEHPSPGTKSGAAHREGQPQVGK